MKKLIEKLLEHPYIVGLMFINDIIDLIQYCINILGYVKTMGETELPHLDIFRVITDAIIILVLYFTLRYINTMRNEIKDLNNSVTNDIRELNVFLVIREICKAYKKTQSNIVLETMDNMPSIFEDHKKNFVLTELKKLFPDSTEEERTKWYNIYND
ncbi:MAG: hypothetical protein ACLQQ4_19775 [Bacteroidia bacterium]